MERHRIHRLVVVEDGDETTPIGLLSMTDLIHALPPRPPTTPVAADPVPMTDMTASSQPTPGRAQGSRRAECTALTRPGAAAPGHGRLRRGVRAERRPRLSPRRRRPRVARRRGPGPERHSAGHGGGPRLQPPGPADPRAARREVRGLHGLRQRLPGHGDPWRRRARARSWKGTSRRSRQTAEQPDLATETARGHFVDTQKYGDVPAQAGDRARERSGSSWTRPLQGLRRVRRGLRGARSRRAVHDRQGRRGGAPRRVDPGSRSSGSGATWRFFRTLPPTPEPNTATRRRSRT